MCKNTNAILLDFSQKSEFQKITFKTAKAKFKKNKRDFPTLLVVSDQEILVRIREQTKIFFCYTVLCFHSFYRLKKLFAYKQFCLQQLTFRTKATQLESNIHQPLSLRQHLSTHTHTTN